MITLGSDNIGAFHFSLEPPRSKKNSLSVERDANHLLFNLSTAAMERGGIVWGNSYGSTREN